MSNAEVTNALLEDLVERGLDPGRRRLFVETEKSCRRIIGYDQLWMLRAHLDDHEPVAEMRPAG